MKNKLLTNYEGIKDIKKGSLVVLAARPFFGKTTFSFNVASDVSNNNQNVIIYTKDEHTERIKEILRKNKGANNIEIDTDSTNVFDNDNHYDLIIIDSLQLINEDDITQLKELAINNNSIIILISELSSDLDDRDEKHPLLTDLKDYILNNVDYVLFMYGDYYYNNDNNYVIELTMINMNNNNVNVYKFLRSDDKLSFSNYEK